MTRILPASFAAALLLFSTRLSAHEEFRTVGVVSKHYVQADKTEILEVNTQEGDRAILWISTQTVVKQDDKMLTKAALKAGVTVVIDSWGDAYDYSEILTARIVPAIAAAK